MRRAALAALALACTHAPAKTSAPTGAIDAIAGDAIAHGTVGLAIVVLHGDDVAFARGYGDADLAKHTPFDERTVVALGSLSKSFWSAGLGQLVDAGKMDVEAPVSRYLPDFPDPRVTVRHLLTQTSGLGDDLDTDDDEHFTDHPTPSFAPGSWWHYSNRGAVIARRVLDHASGVAWPDELANLARGLPSVRVCDAAGDDRATGYGNDHAPAGLTAETMNRVGFVCADALDTARWVRGLATRVAPATWQRMTTPVTIDIDGTAVPMHYGWFLFLDDLDGHAAIGHDGAFPGTNVAAFTFPADDLTIAVVTNTDPAFDADATTLLARVARAWLGLAAPTVTDAPPPADLLAAAGGRYDADGLTLEAHAKDGRLWVAAPALSIDGEAPWAGATTFLGGKGGVSPEQVNDMIVIDGQVRAWISGDHLTQSSLVRRITDTP